MQPFAVGDPLPELNATNITELRSYVQSADVRFTDYLSISSLGTALVGVAQVPMLLFYRTDLFQRHNLSIPDTWEQLLEVAARYNGTDFDGDGVGDYPLCFNADRDCRAAFVLMAIAASYLQVGAGGC
jgi:hypothetical protein